MKRHVLFAGILALLVAASGCIILDDEKETTFISPFGVETLAKHHCRRSHSRHWCRHHDAWDECCDCRRPT